MLAQAQALCRIALRIPRAPSVEWIETVGHSEANRGSVTLRWNYAPPPDLDSISHNALALDLAFDPDHYAWATYVDSSTHTRLTSKPDIQAYQRRVAQDHAERARQARDFDFRYS